MGSFDSKIAALDPVEDSSWDAAVSRLPGYGFFHSSTWAHVLKASYGYSPLYLVSKSGGVVKGCLPIIETDSWLTGRRGVSLPFTDECAPLASDSSSAELLIEEALIIGRKRRWKHFLSHGGGRLLEWDLSKASEPSYHSHQVDLERTPKQIFDSFCEANRRAIRKAEREGVQVETSSSLQAVQSYYHLHRLTRQRHGLPPQPWSFFAQLHRLAIAHNAGFVVLAKCRGRLVAGAVFLHAGTQAVFKYGASDVVFQELRANNLVMWEAMQRLIERGFKTLSLGRTSTQNSGLRRFKLGWGSSERGVWYLKYHYGVEGFVQEEDRTHGWHNALFRHLPRLISRLAGAALYRHWSVVAAGLELCR